MGKGKHIGAGRGGAGRGGAGRGGAEWGGGVVIISTSISTQIPNQKAAKKKKKKKPKSAVNNTVNKLILDRRSSKKLHKKVRFGSPVFITSGIYIFERTNSFKTAQRCGLQINDLVISRGRLTP